jgi:hypothetical protein
MSSSNKPALVDVNKAVEFDSASWRRVRNERLREWIQDEHAISFILDYSDAVELWDDLIDGDKGIDKQHVMRVFVNILTVLPLNPFFNHYKPVLMPLINAALNAWIDSISLEKGSDNDKAIAYVLRDYMHEIFIYTIFLTRGHDYMRSVSLEVRNFFSSHESLEEYRRRL